MRVQILFILCLPWLSQSAHSAESFRRDVMPVFFRAGCNTGSCHGSARGKDGFRLSLFGYDPAGDYFRLTQQMVGRRLNLAVPEQSLLLLKATGKVQHTGGELFKPDSEYYKVLRDWIDAGAPNDAADVPVVAGISIAPEKFLFEDAGQTQAMKVTARYSDGTTRDVTHLARFLTNNKLCADVDKNGVVKAGKRGDTFVFAQFSRFTLGAEAIVLPKGDNYQWPADLKPANYIDERVFGRLQKLHILPSALCDDETFVRRIYLDLTGLPPGVADYRKFMADNAPEKRAALVDALLLKPEFAEVWAAKWGEWLRLAGSSYTPEANDQKAAAVYYEWIVDQMQRNVPWDKFVSAQITASGSNLHDAAANLYTMLPQSVRLEPKDLAQNVAQVFTGIRIQCAQCHNHPFDQWTMDDYYGFVSFFTGIKRKQGAEPREWFIYHDKSAPVAKHLTDDRPVAPKVLGSVESIPSGVDPRKALAEWLTSPENKYFSRNLSNRIWAHFFGRGVTEPVDDFRVTNPPSNPDLMEALSTQFVAYKFDARRLVRDICVSRTYQFSATPNATNRDDSRQFSRASLRRLRADVLLDTLAMATGTQPSLPNFPSGTQAVEFYPRFGSSFDPSAGDFFLETFGRSKRASVCDNETRNEPTLSQTLHLINGETVSRMLRDSHLVQDLAKAGTAPAEIVKELYERALCRDPSAEELAVMLEQVGTKTRDANVYSDIFWGLLNSTEFVFQH